MAARAWIGTSGWVYRHWRGRFYPEDLRARDWFAYYAARFDTVEINNSFYRLPTEAAVEGWRAQAPPGFVYSVKASRYLTHMRKLKEPEDSLERILGRARALQPHLGPVLYQLPPSWKVDAGRLQAFVAALPPDVQHVIEFRDESWYVDPVRSVLEEAGVSFCIHDMADMPNPGWVTGPVVFLRFHGPTKRKYHGSYPTEALESWASRIRGFLAAGHPVYAYFNNDDRAFAAYNALELKSLLASRWPQSPVLGKPCARLVPLEEKRERPLGFLKGTLPESFFDPLPDDELAAWEGS